jgi:hypothetical protein
VSDVTAEEVQDEMKRAGKLVSQWHEGKAAFFGDGKGDALTDVIATALAVRAREARREALMEAAGVCRLRGQFTMAAAIRALMGPES